MKLTVDAERCTGHGRCYAAAPSLLAYDDEGYVTARGQIVDVPDEHAEAARAAAANCPEQAIELVQD
jgi:ferredoxin